MKIQKTEEQLKEITQMDYFITATAYGLNNNFAELTVCLGLFLSFSNTGTGLSSY